MRDPLENIIWSSTKVYVEMICINGDDLYHVFINGITHAECDSAYFSLDLAISRAEFLDKEL